SGPRRTRDITRVVHRAVIVAIGTKTPHLHLVRKADRGSGFASSITLSSTYRPRRFVEFLLSTPQLLFVNLEKAVMQAHGDDALIEMMNIEELAKFFVTSTLSTRGLRVGLLHIHEDITGDGFEFNEDLDLFSGEDTLVSDRGFSLLDGAIRGDRKVRRRGRRNVCEEGSNDFLITIGETFLHLPSTTECERSQDTFNHLLERHIQGFGVGTTRDLKTLFVPVGSNLSQRLQEERRRRRGRGRRCWSRGLNRHN
ncbi:hypothetical protein C8R42DRAFT_753028, partial [Lentinula raphanica]